MTRMISAATAFSVLCLLAGGAIAQEVKVDAPGVKVDAKLNANRAAAGRTLRASKVIGAEVKNNENASLGKIDDVVMDDAGRVHYFIMTHGGVLGVGQKYCAIPLRSVAIRNGDSADSHWVELNISPKALEKAPTFTSDKWPSFTGEDKFVKESDVFFNEIPKTKTP